jgi:hypothetical protein
LPATLSDKDLVRTIGRSQGALRACFQDHKGLLPSPAGVVELSVTVLGSGAVDKVAVGTKLPAEISGCLTSNFKQLKFPKFKQPSVTYDLPFKYETH